MKFDGIFFNSGNTIYGFGQECGSCLNASWMRCWPRRSASAWFAAGICSCSMIDRDIIHPTAFDRANQLGQPLEPQTALYRRRDRQPRPVPGAQGSDT